MAGEQVSRKVEIFHSGAWEDISADAVDHDGETGITRGVRTEGGSAAPGSLELTLNNGQSNVDPAVSSRYARGNALSDLFGLLPPNTPIRVSAGLGSVPATVEEGFEDATLDITTTDIGDAAWARASDQAHTGAWSFKSGTILDSQTSGVEVTIPAGSRTLEFWYRVSSEQGFDFFEVLADTTVLLSASGEVGWTRRVISVAGVTKVTFQYTKDSIESAGSDAAWIDDLTFGNFRMVGELVSLPPRADVSQRDRWVPVEAAGPLRRLGIPSSPLRSPLRRFLPNYHLFDAFATEQFPLYWPCEDGVNSSILAGGVPSAPAMSIDGRPDLASYAGFTGSEPLPRWVDGSRALVSVNLPLPDQPGANIPDLDLLILLHFPAGEIADGTDLISLHLEGTASRVVLQYETANNGILRALTFDADGTQTASLGTNDIPPSPGMDDRNLVLRWRVSLDGTNQHAFAVHELLANGSLADLINIAGGGTGGTVTGLTRVTIAPNLDGGGFVLGHVTVARGSILEIQEMQDAIGGYQGETAGRRVERLCTEQGVSFTSSGDLDATAPLGPQQLDNFLTILDQAAKVEAAGSRAPILVEQRTGGGLHFNALNALYLPRSSGPDLTLDYSEAHLSEPFDPTPDDFGLVNDATASRRDGGSARVEVFDGEKGINSAGRVDRADTFDAQTDAQLSGIAGWWAFHGTWDEPRYPTIRINMRSLSLRTDGAALVAAVQALDEGALVEIANPPEWLPQETIQQMVLEIRDTISTEEWLVDLHTTAAGPFTVFLLGDAVFGRIDTKGSELAMGVDAAETSLLVSFASGVTRWVTDAERPGDFPFSARLGGEVVTVTGISGTVSPQTFTATRAVNGISRSWPAGTSVRIARIAVAP